MILIRSACGGGQMHSEFSKNINPASTGIGIPMQSEYAVCTYV